MIDDSLVCDRASTNYTYLDLIINKKVIESHGRVGVGGGATGLPVGARRAAPRQPRRGHRLPSPRLLLLCAAPWGSRRRRRRRPRGPAAAATTSATATAADPSSRRRRCSGAAAAPEGSFVGGVAGTRQGGFCYSSLPTYVPHSLTHSLTPPLSHSLPSLTPLPTTTTTTAFIPGGRVG